MPVGSRIALVAMLVLSGCGGPPAVQLLPAPQQDAIAAGDVATTLFLIGDAGSTGPGDRVLAEIVRQGRAASRDAVIIFLGDNIYPRGIPPDTARDYPESKRRLFAQTALADSTGLRVIFVPGNHDWDRHRETGWAQIQRQGLLIEQYAREKSVPVELQPRGGCPGPVVTDIGGAVRLIAIDTQWWLHSRSRPGRSTEATRATLPEPDLVCPITTEARLVDSLRSLNATGRDRVTVMLAHHPLESHGEHGGYHPIWQWIFPLVPTPIAPWAWLPIGWIYPLGRRLVGDRQDFHGPVNREMRRAIESSFSEWSPFIYASGHDHSLELIRHGAKRFFMVSGAGEEDHQSAVGRGDSTAYSSPRPGFMRVDILKDRRIRVGVTILDRDNRAREAYQAWLTDPK